MYNTPQWYQNLRDISLLWQVFGGTMIFCCMLPKRNSYNIRCLLFWMIGGIGMYLFYKTGLPFAKYLPNVVLIYIINIIMVYACCDVSGWTAWMIGATGFLAQHTCGNLELAFRILPGISGIFDFSWHIILLDFVIYGSGYGIIYYFFRNNSLQNDNDISNTQKVMFSLLSMMFTFVYYLFNQYVLGWENVISQSLAIDSLYSCLGGGMLMVLLYDIIKRQRAARENHDMQTLLYMQAKQYQTSLDNMELVNEKYHDLKKMIHSFKGVLDSRQLDALYQSVDAYDDKVKTGHEIVDIVLMEARTICRKNGIQLTCYVNGAGLMFMEKLDLYFLLKNILDNAVEAVRELPKEKERFISLTARNDGGMTTIHTENPCNDVEISDGIPVTKKDSLYHGYGIKSMMHIAEEYGGALTCDVRNHVFYMDVILFDKT